MRGQKSAASSAEGLLSLDDLFGVIPGQQQQNVRLFGFESRRWNYALMRAGDAAALLCGRGVDDERQQIGPDATVVQDDRAFRRRAIPDHFESGLAELDEFVSQLQTRALQQSGHRFKRLASVQP